MITPLIAIWVGNTVMAFVMVGFTAHTIATRIATPARALWNLAFFTGFLLLGLVSEAGTAVQISNL